MPIGLIRSNRWSPPPMFPCSRLPWGLGMAAAIIGLLAGLGPAWAQEALRLEQPPPTSVEESPTSSDVSFRVPPLPAPPPTTLRERLQEPLKELPPFFRDTQLNFKPRTFYFYRDNYDRSLNAAWALGGRLDYKSGYLLGHVALGASYFTSNRLYGPLDRGGTGLLRPGQQNINVLGQLYGEIKTDHLVINLFRKEYNTPYINAQDNRMLPNTFEAYTFIAQIGDLKEGSSQFRFGGGYFTKMKERDASSFVPMSRAAGVRQDRGVAVAGAVFETKNFSLGAFNYYSQDVINIFYTEAKVNLPLKSGLGFQLAGQFTDQESAGDNLLLNRPFSTRQFGFKWGASYKGALLNLAYTKNAIGGTDLQENWGSYPGYTSVQARDFNRAGEQAFLIQGTYDFSRLGLEGVTAYALWVRGWSRVNPTTRQPVSNEDEVDLDLQWKPKGGLLQGLWFRLRYAHVSQRGGNNPPLNEIRLIVNYHLPVL